MSDQHGFGVGQDLRAGLFGALWIAFLTGFAFWDLQMAGVGFLLGIVLTGLLVMPTFLRGVSCD